MLPSPPRAKRRLSFAAVRGTRTGGWTTVYLDLARWVAIAVPIGVVAGLGSALFYYMLELSSTFFLTQLGGITLPNEGVLHPTAWASSFPRILIVPALMALGGLIVGFIISRLAPEVAGHGTDATIRAFHRKAGKVRYRVPLLKTLASAITLGTGGSGGREGPTSQIGGGFGSLWADVFGLNDRERRVALATGMGAGIGAIFRAPLGGAIYAAEILYTGDFEPDVFVPAIIASVVAYSVYSSIFQFHTLFATPDLSSYAFDPRRLPLYALLGIICGGAGILFTKMYQRTDAWFSTRRWPVFLRPTVGAAIAGAIFLGAYILVPQQDHFAALSSLSVGYGFVQTILGDLSSGGTGAIAFTFTLLSVLLIAVFVRMVMTSFVVGSGGSAGLFGTSVVVGSLLGAMVGGTAHDLLPSLVPLPVVAVFSIVGMMSFFGGISKAPLGVLIMVVEMVASYSVLPAAMLAIFTAYVVTGRNHIYSEQLPTRIHSPAHLEEYRNFFLSETPIADVARQESETVPPSMNVRSALEIAVTHGRAILSVDDGVEWVGAVRLNDLLDVPMDRRSTTLLVDLVRPVDLLLPGDLSSEEALRRMQELDANVAAVLSVDEPVRVVGLVTRRAIRAPGRPIPRAGTR